MELPEGMVPEGDESNKWTYVLKLNKSLYGLKQALLNWCEKLKVALENQEFSSSQIDSCFFVRNGMVVLMYVDDCIIVSDNQMKINALVHLLKHGPEEFILMKEGSLDKLLGIFINKKDDGQFELSRPFLINWLVTFVENGTELDMNERETPKTIGKTLLHKDKNGKPRKHDWNYRTAVVITGYF